jgi:signal transduction histidine kinase
MVVMPHPPVMFPEGTRILAALAGSAALAAAIHAGLHREAAFFVLGAAACGIGLMAGGRLRRSLRPDPPALQLLESAADELKGSLHIISGLSETISGWSAREGAEWRGSCKDLVETTRKLALFTAQLHDYARFERSTLRLPEQQVDAGELVAAALATCGENAERADVFITADLSGSAEIRCDALRIRQAVASLVSWVIATSPPASNIRISLARRTDHGLEIRVGNPAGLSPAPDIATLFEPPVPLNGLNSMALPVARRVLLLHCGDVRAEAAPDAGTSAVLHLPPHRVDWPETA